MKGGRVANPPSLGPAAGLFTRFPYSHTALFAAAFATGLQGCESFRAALRSWDRAFW
jgi:hypothetical protein